MCVACMGKGVGVGVCWCGRGLMTERIGCMYGRGVEGLGI